MTYFSLTFYVTTLLIRLSFESLQKKKLKTDYCYFCLFHRNTDDRIHDPIYI